MKRAFIVAVSIAVFAAGGAWWWASRADPLEEVVRRSRATRSDALVVLVDGETLIADGAVDRPIETMSVTKSFVSLAYGFLLAEGRVRSLDQPVADFVPEWREGAKGRVTLRHLLSHTSGLDDSYAAGANAEDAVAHAIAAPLVTEPGAVFAYNNNATNLAAELVKRASGESIDAYLATRLFAPLGIRDVSWAKDRAGNAYGMWGLKLSAGDLAKVGQLLLEDGRDLISSEWLRQSTREASQPLDADAALLWWRVQFGEAVLARGLYGQYLFVHPGARLVVVRLREHHDGDPADYAFEDFVDRAMVLARSRLRTRAAPTDRTAPPAAASGRSR